MALDGAARHDVAFALQLPPDLVSVVDAQVGLHTLSIWGISFWLPTLPAIKNHRRPLRFLLCSVLEHRAHCKLSNLRRKLH